MSLVEPDRELAGTGTRISRGARRGHFRPSSYSMPSLSDLPELDVLEAALTQQIPPRLAPQQVSRIEGRSTVGSAMQERGANCGPGAGCGPASEHPGDFQKGTRSSSPQVRQQVRTKVGRGFSRISPGLGYPGGHSSGLSDSRFLRITALSGERERTGCFRTRDSREFGV